MIIERMPGAHTAAWLAKGLALALIVGLGAGSPAAAALPDPVGDQPAEVAPTTGPAPADATFTLLTGDVVTLVTAADGTPSGEVVVDAGPPGDIVFQQVGDDLYALPGTAVRLIGEGRLDQELFNLTQLAEYGYHDAGSATLPVIAAYDGAQAATQAGRRAPAGTQQRQTLESIDAQVLAVEKDHAEQAWADLTAPASKVASLWLDAKVEPTLDISAPAVGAPAAWAAGLDGTGTRIAVLDTGIDLAHPDFAGRIAGTSSFVPGQDVQDGYGHGTHVASIAAGAGDTYRGVAPGAELIVGKVLSNEGAGQVSWVIEGMEWAAAQGVDVVNMSLGGGPDNGRHPLAQAVNRISDETGTLFVIAAGNERHLVSSTITWPGSADRALTVGSVAKTGPHRVSSFSSVGPRAGDHAIKPEITAPGAGIVAACAAGSQFSCSGAQYVSASGTSMAAPHVAGAAAVLAQQHPDWTRDQLRDALISTADPNPTDPLTWQGGGMLDLAGATGSPLFATGTVHLGRIEPPYPDTASAEVTLRNTSGQPVVADLALVLRESDDSLVRDTPYQPAEGAVTISPSTVDIPAGESTTVTLTVRLAQFELGTYHGWLRASTGDQVLTRTTVGWTKSPELHRLNIRGIDRAGRPAHTTTSSFLNLFDLDTGEHRLGWWVNGVAFFNGLGSDPLLPQGRYALLANISDWTVQAPFSRDTETLISETELVMDQDRSFTFDAREASRVEFGTPRPAEPQSRYLAYSFGRRWVVNGRNAFVENWPTIPGVYMFPTQVTETDAGDELGRFETTFGSVYTPQDLTLTVLGADRPTLQPEYLREDGQAASCTFPMCNTWFESDRTYRLADGGSGTPEELAAADVAGRLVLIREVPHPEFDLPLQYERLIPGIVAAAKRAGAAGVVYAVSDPGPPFRGWNTRRLTEPIGIPVAVISHAEGAALTAALAGPDPVLIRAGGQPQAPYLYYLRRTVEGPLPAETRFTYTDDQFAAVETYYHSEQPGTVLHLVGRDRIITPFVRTEYLVGGEAFGLNVIDPDLGATLATPSGWERGTRQYPAGTTAVEHIRARPIAPGTATLTADGSFLSFAALPRAGSDRFFLSYAKLKPVQLRYHYDGQVICERDSIAGCSTFGVAGDGRYQIELAAGLDFFPGGPSHTTWQVNVEFPDDPAAAARPPLVNVAYDVGVGMDNTVRGGLRYPITLTTGYQFGFEGADGEFTTSAWVSYDDGTTWTALGTQSGDQSQFWVRPPRDAEHTSLRVRAEDAEGNSVEQTLLRAWEVTPTGER